MTATGGSNGGPRPGREGRRHVLMVVPGRPGGIDRMAGYLLAAWSGVAGLPPVLVVRSRGPRLLLSPLFLLAVLLRLLADGLRGRVALLHVNLASRGSTLRKLPVVALAAALRVPVVLQLHGGLYREFYAGLSAPAQRAVAWMFRRAACVLVLGEAWRSFVAEAIAVAPQRLRVLPNGVPDPLAGGPPPRRRNNAAPLVLFLGRLAPPKGVEDLLAALAHERLRDTGWRALLAGDGDAEAVRARVRALGLGDRVQVAGWLDPAATREALADADVFVLPSHAEGLSVALLEAMAWALPVVVTPVGAHGEVVCDGETGLLVEVGDVLALAAALQRLLTEPTSRRAMGAAGRARFLVRYELGSVLRQLCDAYDGVLARS